MATNNSINASSSGLVRYNGTGTFDAVTLGTSGQILTSNGPSTLPTFQTAPAGVFAPNAVLNYVEDFIAPASFTAGSNYVNSFVRNATSGFTPTVGIAMTPEAGHPGMLGHDALGAGALAYLIGGFPTDQAAINLGGGVWVINWVFKIDALSTGTNSYTLWLGIGDNISGGTEPSNGCYFEYSDGINSGQWNVKTASGGVRTTTSSSTAVTTGWHNAQITVNAGATSVNFTIDGVSLGNNAANIPTTAPAMIGIIRGAGTIVANTVLVDLFYATQTLTSAR